MSLLQILKNITSHPLNQSAKLRAVARFINWQLYARLIKDTKTIDYIDSAKLIVKKGFSSSTAEYYNGLDEFSEGLFLLHFLRDEDLFVDVGANVGVYTILASKVVGAKSIAFEPVPATFQLLGENIRLNEIENKVDCINAVVGFKKGYTNFSIQHDQQNHVVAKDEEIANSLEIKSNTLDFFLKNKNPIFIKIDVEGFEKMVVAGAMKTLQNSNLKVVIIELMGLGKRYGVDENEIHQQLTAIGFTIFQYQASNRKLLKKENYQSKNIYIRDLAFVKERIETARQFRILGQDF